MWHLECEKMYDEALCWIRSNDNSKKTPILMRDLVPYNLGFQHITHEEVIENHIHQLSRDLLTDDITSNPAILVLDGVYIYV